MYRDYLAYNHTALFQILQARNLQDIEENMPLWKLKLTGEEYDSLKQTLVENYFDLEEYGMEAALCYAEWWRRDYRGNIPSKESVAMGIGIEIGRSEELYIAARKALKRHGYSFIHTSHGTQYFRTLLNQGGLPVNYIKKSENLGSFTLFLKGLVCELSSINYDWNSEDFSVVDQLNCTSYLGKTFKNENIYDVAMQIAHAIVMGDNSLLPYDDTDSSLAALTQALKKEYSRAKNDHRTRPFSLHWKLYTSDDGTGTLYVNMDIVKDVSSLSIPGLNFSTCYSFDVFVAGILVGKYVRKGLERDEDGNVLYAIYTRITVGLGQDIKWNGEPVVEVKVRCDNDDRIFMTIAGCYPPNFDYPQIFQMLEDNQYRFGETANTEHNIAIFTQNWKVEGAKPIVICGKELYCHDFTKDLVLYEEQTNECVKLTNTFTPYIAEFSDNYISWVEESNFKLLSKIPIVRVYDKERKRVPNCMVKYRFRNECNTVWHKLNTSCVFPCGVVDICVDFPDGHSTTESFYSIGNLKFNSDNEDVFSTDIICLCDNSMFPEMELDNNIEINRLLENKWRISRSKDATICPTVCKFKLYKASNPVLRISVAIPFDGISITDIQGNIVPNGKIISLTNLTSFSVVSHGGFGKKRHVDVSYVSDKIDDYDKLIHLKSNVVDGLISLADYTNLIMRMFYLYGENSFDRSSSVALNISYTKLFIRKFVLDSTLENGRIRIIDNTEEDTTDFIYDDDIYAFPVGDDLSLNEFNVIKLEHVNNSDNKFSFPEDFTQKEVVVFSSPKATRRIVPKYYNRLEYDYDKDERTTQSVINTRKWHDDLNDENVMTGKHWQEVCKAFDICSRYYLPFTTYNGLKTISREPMLLAKFVIAMWLNEYKDILTQDVDRFEQEMVIAFHWIPAEIWETCICDLMQNIPETLVSMMSEKLPTLVNLLQDIFDATMSTEIAQKFAAYLISGSIEKGNSFTISDINNYCTRIHGLSDNNKDLPILNFNLTDKYYNNRQRLLPYYRVMIESAMCAAENTCNKQGGINLFSHENKEYARIVNFYRKYFKETYSDIFFKTIRYITASK
ncbi:hypothetical protein [Bacteroides pyogenes]|uniref:hypothetical protein n=1 Tax=Bacteroides pyogenes TaxID=310300 RepID=UPI002A7FD330|nr:hypothetical protein [Bacteroides pyogenes]MDY4250209.1 hypothetical protein [Bacteroides pyogenes]